MFNTAFFKQGSPLSSKKRHIWYIRKIESLFKAIGETHRLYIRKINYEPIDKITNYL